MIFNRSALTEKYKDFLYEKYNVLAHVDSIQIDYKPQEFQEFLHSLKKEYYLPNERIVIEHMDTDYYHDDLRYGMFIRNLIRSFQNLDIPTYVLLLYTNHFGIQKEIHNLLTDKNDLPTVIETFVYQYHIQSSYEDHPIDVEEIQMPALSLMGGSRRGHRHAFYDFVVKNKFEQYIAISKSGHA